MLTSSQNLQVAVKETKPNKISTVREEVSETQIDFTHFESQAKGSQAWYLKFFNITQTTDRDNRQQNVTCKLCGVRVSPRGTRIRKHFRKHHLDAISKKDLEDLETPEESTLIKKYFTPEVMPDFENAACLAECTLCQGKFKTDKRSLLIDHLFDLHSDSLSKELEDGNLETSKDAACDDDDDDASLLAFKAKLGLRTTTSEISSGRSKTWWYSDLVTVDEVKKAKCNLCHKIVSPKVEILRLHVLQYHAKELESDPTLLEEKSTEFANKKAKDRRNPIVWKYFQVSSVIDNGREKIVGTQCLVCQEWVSPKVARLRTHCRKYHPELKDITDSSRSTRPSSRMENEEQNRKWVQKYFDKYNEDEGKDDDDEEDDDDDGAGKEVEQVRCRICLEVISSKSGNSYDHLVEQHPGILEFSSDYVETEDSINKHIPPVLKGGRRKDIVWSFFNIKKMSDPKNALKICQIAFCIRCNAQVSPRAYRLWLHLKNSHPDLNNTPIVENEDAKGELLTSDIRIEEDPVDYSFVESEYVLPGSPIQQVEEPQEYKHFPSFHSHQRKGKTKRSRIHKKRNRIINTKCVLCQNVVSSSRITSTISSWNQSCAKSLCELFNLDKSYLQYFEAVKYCDGCQELVRNIDFTQKALKNLNNMLKKYQHTYESFLQNNYKSCSGSHSSGTYSYDGLVHAIYNSISHDKESAIMSPGILGEVTSKLGDIRGKRQKPLKWSHSTVEDSMIDFTNEEEKKPNVVEHISKYGRTCTSVNFNESVEPTNQDDSSDAENLSDDGSDWVPDSPVSHKKKARTIQSSQRLGKGKNLRHPKLLSGIDFLKQRILLGRKARRLHFIKKQHLNSMVSSENNIKLVSQSKSRKKRSGKRLVCQEPNCTFSCYKKKWLDTHVRARHENDDTPFLCEFDGCGKKFTSLTSYAYHNKRHTTTATHSCSYCGKMFFEKWALTKHYASAHATPKDQKCSFCSKTFKLDEGVQLNEHEKLHEVKADGIHIYGCVLCDEQTFTNSFDLKTHVARTHNLYTAKCPKCGKVFKLASSLRKHLALLHCERHPNLNCSECNYLSRNKSDLVRHLSSHRIERPFLCAECGATFPNKNHLKVHMMLHTGEAPYQCKFCTKAFNQSSKLKAHEEIHVPTKNYVCDKCGKRFRTAKNIYQHKRFHCHERVMKNGNPIRTRPRRMRKQTTVIMEMEMDTDDDAASNASVLSLTHSHKSRDSINIINSEDTSSPDRILIDTEGASSVEEQGACNVPLPYHLRGGHYVPWISNEVEYTHQQFNSLDLSQNIPCTAVNSQVEGQSTMRPLDAHRGNFTYPNPR